MYDYVFLTHLPVFYKVNLYNELAKKLKIYVIFIGNDTCERRVKGFSQVSSADFDYKVIFNGDFQARNKSISALSVIQELKKTNFKSLVVSGWDLPEFWLAVFTTFKSQVCLALESSVIESQTTGIKSWLKKLFLSRISTVFASGSNHAELLQQLKFKGDIRITHGVGLINKPEYKPLKKVYSRRYLFIGRLVEVKNLSYLIRVFNKLPDFNLSIVGDGPLKKELQSLANANIEFVNSIDNNQLMTLFDSHDLLILPSQSEPWGLVIEEALYFGVPVIVSNRCGAACLITEYNGYVFDLDTPDSLYEIIKNINESNYTDLLIGVQKYLASDKDLLQSKAYVI